MKSSSSSDYSNKRRSYGIICVRRRPHLEYLMVARKHSIGFLQIALGRYKPRNIRLLRKLVLDMTARERSLLSLGSFEIIAQDVFGHYDSETRKDAKEKFEVVHVGYAAPPLKEKKSAYYPSFYFQSSKFYEPDTQNEYVSSWHRSEGKKWVYPAAKNKNEWISWYSLCQKAKPYIPNLAWGFPKGLAIPGESAMEAAVREFWEETNMPKDDYFLLPDFIPIWEIFVGLNGKSYNYTYFIAECNDTKTTSLHLETEMQKQELSEIRWLCYDEAYEKIRPSDNVKRSVLHKLHKELSKLFKLEYRQ